MERPPAPTGGVTVGLTAPYGKGRPPSESTAPRPPLDGDLAAVAVGSRDAERVARHAIRASERVRLVDATPDSLDAPRGTRVTRVERLSTVEPVLDRWLRNTTGRPVVWLPSVAAVFDRARVGRAHGFVETLADRVQAFDARLHLTVDRTALDATTVGTLLSVADSVAEPTPDGLSRARAE